MVLCRVYPPHSQTPEELNYWPSNYQAQALVGFEETRREFDYVHASLLELLFGNLDPLDARIELAKG